jgi:hypothetical protein
VSRKIEALVQGMPRAFAYGNVFSRQTIGGTPRLRIALDGQHDTAVRALVGRLPGPFQLLYVLHTTRTGAALGRYESPELSAAAVDDFVTTFGGFLCQDARHDVWVRSPDDDATIVWDRHNLIYAYGPLEPFESVLRHFGVRSGAPPPIPDPHVHHYHREWDPGEDAVLHACDWCITPLQEPDVQFVETSH